MVFQGIEQIRPDVYPACLYKKDRTIDSLTHIAAGAIIGDVLLGKKLGKRAEDDPVCRRFLEIPGVGPITALSFYCAVEDPARFRRNADVGAFLGLVPMVRQSGQNVARLHISKMGDRMTRTYLTTAAQQHLRHGKSSLTAWGAGLSERLRKGAVQVAVARKLAVTMLAMWKSGERYDPYRGASPADVAVKAEPSVVT